MGSAAGTTRTVDLGASALVSPKLRHAAWLLMAMPDLRDYFLTYLRGKQWVLPYLNEILQGDDQDDDLVHDCDGVIFGRSLDFDLPKNIILPKELSLSVDCSDESSKATTVLSDLSRSFRVDQEITETEFTFRRNSVAAPLVTPTENAIAKNMKLVIIAGVLLQFIDSSDFRLWTRKNVNSPAMMDAIRNEQFSAFVPSKIPDSRVNSVKVMEECEFSETFVPHISMRSGKLANKRLEHLRKAILYYMSAHSTQPLKSLLSTTDWIEDMLRFLNELPFSISVASMAERQSMYGNTTLPIIYVNSAFEMLTKYSRDEIIGKNCRILQSDGVTEVEQVIAVRNSLREHRAIKVAITNVRKDGTPFFNLLSLRPVLNRADEVSHVLAIQYELDWKAKLQEKVEGRSIIGKDLQAIEDSIHIISGLFY